MWQSHYGFQGKATMGTQAEPWHQMPYVIKKFPKNCLETNF